MKLHDAWEPKTWLRVAAMLADERTASHVLEPLVADVLHEEALASTAREAAMVRVRGLVHLSTVLIAVLVTGYVRRLVTTPWHFLVAPWAAGVSGIFVMASTRETATRASPQLVYMALATAAAFAMAPMSTRRLRQVSAVWAVAVLTLLVVVATCGRDVGGVRRWVGIGPWIVQPSLLLWPFALASASGLLAKRRFAAALSFAVAALGSLVPQRDVLVLLLWGAGLAASFVAAFRRRTAACLVAISAFAAYTIDEAVIPPSPATEGILSIMAQQSGLALAVTALAAGLVVCAPLSVIARAGADPLLTGIAASLFVLAMASLTKGAPVALVGYGGSSVLAVFVATAFTMQRARELGRGAAPAPSGGEDSAP